MDLAEALFHANWSSSCSTTAEAPSSSEYYSEMMAQLLDSPPPSIAGGAGEPHHDQACSLGRHAPFSWSVDVDHCAESSHCSYNSDPCCSYGSCLLPPPDLIGCHNPSVWMGFCTVGGEETVAAINEETGGEDFAGSGAAANPVEFPKPSPKRKSHVRGQGSDSSIAVPRKKLRSLQKKNGKNEQPIRKIQNGIGIRGVAGESDGGENGWPDSGGCCSEEESTSSQDGKARAGHGAAATDPQSLYARKRRERINERLRILQKLVPNGTKVDISTMLEEAVRYVKFLQLQIKLLSSDDLWMYASIACNGMDIGLVLKSSPLQ